MFQSPSRKFKKSDTRQMRPSLFLNEFDLTCITQQIQDSKLEKIDNTTRKPIAQQEFKEIRTEMTENNSGRFLVSLNDKRNSDSTQASITQSRFQSKCRLLIPNSEKVSPQSKSELKLPSIQPTSISPIQPQKLEIQTHRRNYTNVEIPSLQKRVEFRKSIVVIDFINNIIKKDQIDGSVKPLKKKMVRQQTRFIKN